MSNEFKIITETGNSQLRILGSKFIGKAFSIDSESEMIKYLEAQKKEFFDATHWCYAARIGFENPLEKSHDDGEPKGTAGKPILSQIQHHAIFNVLVIVIRYYGGTNLGTGGLARAYGECAGLALSDAKTTVKKRQAKLSFSASLDDLGIVYSVSNKLSTQIHSSSTAVNANFEIVLDQNNVSIFCERLKEMSNGRIIIKEVGTCIC